MGPWGPILDAVMRPFAAAAGWAWDTVVNGISDWLAKGFVMLATFVWEVMDRTSTPRLQSDWFANQNGAPYRTAVAVAAGLLAIFVFCALIQGILAGRPIELVQRMLLGTPTAVAGILFTAAVTQVGVDLVDAMSVGIWSATRANAVDAMDGLVVTSMKVPPNSFLTPLLLLIGMLALLMLWVVLVVRESLIYLVVALAPMAWATSVWPAISSIRRRTLELLAALVFSKLAIAMALAVGLGALGGLGGTGEPRDSAVANGFAEFSTLLVGIVTFGMAAFMPFVVLKLVPIVEAAVVAHEVRGAPTRAAQAGLQYTYYFSGVNGRLAGTGPGVGGAGLAGGPDSVAPAGGPHGSDPATRSVGERRR
jgi:hypothetical protein